MATYGVNKATLIGNLGKDPEFSMTKTNKEFARFSMATSESWINKASGEKQTKVQWHNIVVFNPGLIELIRKYVKKGNKIYVEGSLHTRKWTDQNNIDRYSTDIILNGYNATIQLLEFNDDKGNYKNNNSQDYDDIPDNSDIIDDEIPF